MSRSQAVSIENNFSKGLITEATAMNYPENSVVETDNCVYLKNGKVIRRYGIDYEAGHVITNLSTMSVMGSATTPSDFYDDLTIQEYEWTTVNNNGSISFVVVQIGDRLNFFNVTTNNYVSPNRKSFTVNIKDFMAGTIPGDVGEAVASQACSFSSGFGYLFVAHPLCDPFYIEYDEDTDAITATQIDIKVRDFERLDDGLTIDNRPSSLTDLHKYNLYNQGWYISAKNASSTTTNVVSYWDGARTDFPSNSDIWWAYKNSSELIDSGLFDTEAFGNTPAPNGHYIYDAFLVDRDAVLGTTGLPEVTSGDNRPSCTAFYAGRVWYAGVKATQYSPRFYFSKIIESPVDFGVCHQVNDPTSEVNSDLLESDGGVIVIPDIARVLRIVPVGPSLLIFASNGVWKISGPNNVFTANDFAVTKISTVGITASNSLVIAEGLPFWWDSAGIYSMQFDPTSGQETVVNVSEATVQTLINNIPDDNIAHIKSAYNSISKTIQWLYSDQQIDSITERYEYNKLLVLNLATQGFSDITLSLGTPKVCGLVYTSNSNLDALVPVEGASLTKFLTLGSIGTAGATAFTFSQFNNDSFVDWFTYDNTGINFESFFITGYRVRGDLLRKFQSNYVVVVSQFMNNASAYIQGIWDYSNSTYTGKETRTQQVYRYDTEKDYSRSKLKVRGNGYSLQFKFKSEDGKPFAIVGWAVAESGNTTP